MDSGPDFESPVGELVGGMGSGMIGLLLKGETICFLKVEGGGFRVSKASDTKHQSIRNKKIHTSTYKMKKFWDRMRSWK